MEREEFKKLLTHLALQKETTDICDWETQGPLLQKKYFYSESLTKIFKDM